ncbi:hypothetical protein TNCV_3091461 [Trichonephila clavipes]|uniref:Uncharacterized protein n=1 Tax=Trichonephila clavipes TaxID=2585209 RepID=A0A8X6W9A5_TRICX|nr:hypothetical protein TNCV_3091461 [Trichonephila clavipes]
MTLKRESNSLRGKSVGWYLNSQSRTIAEKADLNIYSSLLSVFRKKFIRTTGIAVIAFSPYSGSGHVKRHRMVPLKAHVSSTHLSNHLLKYTQSQRL